MKISFHQTLFWKLSSALLILLIILSILACYLFDVFFKRASDRSEQILNWSLANSISTEIGSVISNNYSQWDLQNIFDTITNHNPKIGVYILDQAGRIVAYSGKLQQQVESVYLPVIKEFLNSNSFNSAPLYGVDPANPKRNTIFSASPMYLFGKEHFLYVILNNDDHRQIFTVAQVYSMFLGAPTIAAITFTVVSLGGLSLFYILTRRLRNISSVVADFRQGNFAERIQVKNTKDEIGFLANTINTMADSIVSNLSELKHKDSLRRELIANVSHDLRSPAAIISGMTELILSEDPSLTPETRKRCEAINISNSALNKLLAELFELAKLEAKELVLEMNPFSATELADEIAMTYQTVAKKHNITIEAAYGNDVPDAIGDVSLIGRVLTNLLDNAVRYTPAGGKVTIAVREEKGVMISVSDTGIGIPVEDLPNVFERFYQVKQHNGRANGLSGLGLAIVQRIIEAHKSKIVVDSIQNQGTTFSFTLPISTID